MRLLLVCLLHCINWYYISICGQAVMAQSVGSWAEKRKVLGSNPRADKAWKMFLIKGQGARRAVCVSKVPKPKQGISSSLALKR